MPTNNTQLEKNLWDAADELCTNSRLHAADYSISVLGLLFLKHADHKFAHATEQLKAKTEESTSRRRQRDPLSPDRYKAAGVLYLPDKARFERLVQLPEVEHVGRKINDAMKAIQGDANG
jgi:type I restriction enzyme M protein